MIVSLLCDLWMSSVMLPFSPFLAFKHRTRLRNISNNPVTNLNRVENTVDGWKTSQSLPSLLLQWAIKPAISLSFFPRRNHQDLTAGLPIVCSPKCARVGLEGVAVGLYTDGARWPRGPDARTRLGMASETPLRRWSSFPSISLFFSLSVYLSCL